MTNWMETIIFLLRMGELRMVCDCLCLCLRIYTVHGSQSIHVSGPVYSLPPPWASEHVLLAKVSRPLGFLVEYNSDLPTRLRHY